MQMKSKSWAAGRESRRRSSSVPWRSATLGLGLGLAALTPRAADASGFGGRLSLGPTYMKTNGLGSIGDSSGPGLAAQLDAGLQLWRPLLVHATLIYDYSRWLQLRSGTGDSHAGSMLGFGIGATARLAGVSLGGAIGGQFTYFPQNDDPASGPNGAGLGPLVSLHGGYVWALEGALNAGLHAVFRYRRSEDETNSIIIHPSGYQLGLMLSFGLDGAPLHGDSAGTR